MKREGPLLILTYILFHKNKEPFNQVGVFGDESLFFARSFPYQQQTTAIPTNGFYSYYSNNEIPGEPFGFAASPDIYLGPFDFFGSRCELAHFFIFN